MFMLSFYRFLNNESTIICNTYEGLIKKKIKFLSRIHLKYNMFKSEKRKKSNRITNSYLNSLVNSFLC